MVRSKLILIIISVLCFSPLSSQNFSKSYDFIEGRGERGWLVSHYDGANYIISSYICPGTLDGCFTIAKVDLYGDVKWIKDVNWTDGANNKFVDIRNDTIFIATHANNFIDGNFLYTLILNTEGDSLSLIENNYPSAEFLAHEDLLLHGDKCITSGQIVLQGDILSGLINIRDSNDSIQKILIESPGFDGNVIEELNSISDTILYGLLYKSDDDGYQRDIFSLDNDNNIEYIWSSDHNLSVNDVTSELAIMPNGNLVVLDVVDGFGSENIIRCIDKDGTELWHYNYPDIWPATDWWIYSIYDIKCNDDNEIYGCGSYEEYSEVTGSWETFGYIFKMSPDGDMIWERTYGQYLEDISDYTFSFFFCIDIKDDGGIVLSGDLDAHGIEGRRAWLVSLDADGCLDTDDCGDMISDILLSDNNILVDSDSPIISPNPTDDNIRINNISGDHSISIFDVHGRLVSDTRSYISNQLIDLRTLVSGLYYVRIVSKDSGKTYTQKIVKSQ